MNTPVKIFDGDNGREGSFELRRSSSLRPSGRKLLSDLFEYYQALLNETDKTTKATLEELLNLELWDGVNYTDQLGKDFEDLQNIAKEVHGFINPLVSTITTRKESKAVKSKSFVDKRAVLEYGDQKEKPNASHTEVVKIVGDLVKCKAPDYSELAVKAVSAHGRLKYNEALADSIDSILKKFAMLQSFFNLTIDNLNAVRQAEQHHMEDCAANDPFPAEQYLLKLQRLCFKVTDDLRQVRSMISLMNRQSSNTDKDRDEQEMERIRKKLSQMRDQLRREISKLRKSTIDRKLIVNKDIMTAILEDRYHASNVTVENVQKSRELIRNQFEYAMKIMKETENYITANKHLQFTECCNTRAKAVVQEQRYLESMPIKMLNSKEMGISERLNDFTQNHELLTEDLFDKCGDAMTKQTNTTVKRLKQNAKIVCTVLDRLKDNRTYNRTPYAIIREVKRELTMLLSKLGINIKVIRAIVRNTLTSDRQDVIVNVIVSQTEECFNQAIHVQRRRLFRLVERNKHLFDLEEAYSYEAKEVLRQCYASKLAICDILGVDTPADKDAMWKAFCETDDISRCCDDVSVHITCTQKNAAYRSRFHQSTKPAVREKRQYLKRSSENLRNENRDLDNALRSFIVDQCAKDTYDPCVDGEVRIHHIGNVLSRMKQIYSEKREKKAGKLSDSIETLNDRVYTVQQSIEQLVQNKYSNRERPLYLEKLVFLLCTDEWKYNANQALTDAWQTYMVIQDLTHQNKTLRSRIERILNSRRHTKPCDKK